MTLFLDDDDFKLHVGDDLNVLPELLSESVDCALTSPPFYGLRDYGIPRTEWPECEVNLWGATIPIPAMSCALGLEPNPLAWAGHLTLLFREVRRILRPHGTLWVECGDSYCANTQGSPKPSADTKGHVDGFVPNSWGGGQATPVKHPTKPKDLLGQPWLLAFALRDDGWWLRQCIIWQKPNAMPESATDRCTTAHSYLFLLSKKPRYFYDADAIAEPAEWARWGDQSVPKYEGTETASGWMQPKTKEQLAPIARRKPLIPEQTKEGVGTQGEGSSTFGMFPESGRKNARTVWKIPTESYPGAHFATWPQALVERILKAGCPEWVCVSCGKPRERVTDVSYVSSRDPGAWNDGKHGGAEGVRDRSMYSKAGVATRSSETVGWSDCGCGAGFTPGTCLDPFMGSGTTALVARRLGRHAVGVELSEEYAKLCAKRTEQLSLLS